MAPKVRWTLELIKAGFDEFHNLNGRWPTALEIDSFKLLPSSRQIQRKWRGLTNLRALLNLPVLDYTKGDIRSEIAREIGIRGKNHEGIIGHFLIEYFGEVFVHGEKPFANRHHRVDFLVYAKGYSFGIDVFYPSDIGNMSRIIALKQESYKDFPFDLYFISANDQIKQESIEKLMVCKKKRLGDHIKVMSFEFFKSNMMQIKALKKPIDCLYLGS
jgi:hypothetical protein